MIKRYLFSEFLRVGSLLPEMNEDTQSLQITAINCSFHSTNMEVRKLSFNKTLEYIRVVLSLLVTLVRCEIILPFQRLHSLPKSKSSLALGSPAVLSTLRRARRLRYDKFENNVEHTKGNNERSRDHTGRKFVSRVRSKCSFDLREFEVDPERMRAAVRWRWLQEEREGDREITHPSSPR